MPNPWFKTEVRNALVEYFGFTHDNATSAIALYEPAFKLLMDGSRVIEVASRISSDIKSGIPVDNYVEYLSFMSEVSDQLSEKMRLPEKPKSRPHEFCYRCGYPKYQDAKCTFC